MSPGRNLDQRLRQRSGEAVGLAAALSNYLGSIQQAAHAAHLELGHAVLDECQEQIKILLHADQDVEVTWTPYRGWAVSCADRNVRQVYFRTDENIDAGAIAPDAHTVAEWLGLVAQGGRPGSRVPPQESRETSQESRETSTALLDRLVMFGSYPGSYAPI